MKLPTSCVIYMTVILRLDDSLKWMLGCLVEKKQRHQCAIFKQLFEPSIARGLQAIVKKLFSKLSTENVNKEGDSVEG